MRNKDEMSSTWWAIGVIVVLIGVSVWYSGGGSSDAISGTTGSGTANIGNVAKQEGSTQPDTHIVPQPQRKAANAAPDFSLPTLDGGTISLAEYRGKKPVVVDFWASWCHNCRRDMPKLNKLYKKYKDQVEVIGINLRENKRTIQKFVDSRDITFPIALDRSGSVSRQYAVRYTNTHVLIDKDGNVIRVINGDMGENDFKSLLR